MVSKIMEPKSFPKSKEYVAVVCKAHRDHCEGFTLEWMPDEQKGAIAFRCLLEMEVVT